MNHIDEDLEIDEFEIERTGDHRFIEDLKVISYPFDKYKIKIMLTPYNEFVGIKEIEIDKDFRSYKEKIATKGFHDVDEFYPE